MRKLNIRKVLRLMRQQIDTEWSKLTFEYCLDKEEVGAQAEVTLDNHEDDILVIIRVYAGGGADFRAVFDKKDKTPEILSLLNDFNKNNSFFTAFIRDDGYLELEHYFVCYEEAMFKSYAGKFLSKLANLSNNEDLQNLTQHTRE